MRHEARNGNRIGVCSWSLRPTGLPDLVAKVRACDVDAVQLALDPIREGLWNERETVAALKEAGISILSGMMGTVGEDYSTLDSIRATGGLRPDGTWEANRRAAVENAELARRLGLSLVTFHAGFLPHDRRNRERKVMLLRLRELADVFAARGVRIAFETGQESAETLVSVLDDLCRPGVGVNFDPANMILYGMGEPVAALRRLAPWVKQIHVKDATPTGVAGTWGAEVAAGTGAVDWRAFFAFAMDYLPGVNLIIEREAGEQRVEDVRAARALIGRYTAGATST